MSHNAPKDMPPGVLTGVAQLVDRYGFWRVQRALADLLYERFGSTVRPTQTAQEEWNPDPEEPAEGLRV